jgi:integrase
MQKGRIFKKGNSWFLHFREPIIKDGEKKWRQVIKKLAPADKQYKSERSVEPLAQEYLVPVNSATLRPESTQSLMEFIEKVYFTKVEKRPSTIFGYKHIFHHHLKDRLGDIRIRDFRTVTGQNLLKRIANETELAHTSLKHIKHFLTGVFTFAKQQGVIDGENPMRDVAIPKGGESEGTYAYSLEEILAMIEVLPEPAKTVVATAAFTGLRRSELRGLRWEDLSQDALQVRRTVWNTHIEADTKTAASRAPVPLVPALQKRLQEHRNGFQKAASMSSRTPPPITPANGFIFVGTKLGRPLNLANLARRVIVPTLEKEGKGVKWYGWHAFRRGLGTNLYRLGIEDKTIQAILRHSNVNTTLTYYVKPVSDDSHAAMRKLQKAFTVVERSSKKPNVAILCAIPPNRKLQVSPA